MNKELIKKLVLTRDKPRIPEGLTIPEKVKTRVDLSDWLVSCGFCPRDRDYWDVFRFLRDEFPPSLDGTEPEVIDPAIIRESQYNQKSKKMKTKTTQKAQTQQVPSGGDILRKPDAGIIKDALDQAGKFTKKPISLFTKK
jgi:hypothetical protein